MKHTVLVNHRSQVANKLTGITRVTFSLLEAMIDRGNFDFALATTWSKNDLPCKIQKGVTRVITVDRVRPYSVNMVKQIFENLGHKTGAAAILNVDQIGLVRGGRARIFIAHDLYFKAIPGAIGLTDRVQQRYFIWPLMLCFNDRIACVSENTRRDIQRFYPSQREKAQFIGSGTNLATAPAEFHPVLDSMKHPYMLYVGNVLPNKNIGTLTKALDIVTRRGLEIRAIHVGRDDEGLLQHATGQMRFAAPPLTVGHVSDGQLRGFYTNAFCLVNTSLYEGFCLPVAEAQEAGTPVICSRMPAVGETAGEGALLFDPRSPVELADHIECLLGDAQLRQRLVSLGRENVRRHAWPRVAERIEALILELLAPSPLIGGLANQV
jgi:glycosyltransferase involved in cell wall biosynthesis